jgi:hypothetical protein
LFCQINAKENGHDAASFVSRIKALLEEPELMLLG